MNQPPNLPPFLTDDEIREICDPLKVAAYQVKFLQRLGLIVNRKPNGKPLVARGEIERVLVGTRPGVPIPSPHAEPDREALFALFGKRKKPAPKKPG